MDSDWIRGQFERHPQKTQIGLAMALGRDPSTVSKILAGKRQIKANEVPRIRAYFEQPEAGEDNQASLHRVIEPARAWHGPDMINIMGTAEGGRDGAIEWNGEVVGRVPRPPFLADVRDAYALYVVGESMVPRYNPGEIVYVHPGRPVPIGGYGVFQLKPVREGAPIRALIKLLARRSSGGVTLAQFNPKRERHVLLADILHMHRIVGGSEA